VKLTLKGLHEGVQSVYRLGSLGLTKTGRCTDNIIGKITSTSGLGI
jgi:hypothetical protein